MQYKTVGVLAVLMSISGFSTNGFADPLIGNTGKSASPKSINFLQLSSLDAGRMNREPLNMSPRSNWSPILEPGIQSKKPEEIQLAGQCGSSIYYCNETGFTYCCGNSTDGFYCAADVNGCTK